MNAPTNIQASALNVGADMISDLRTDWLCPLCDGCHETREAFCGACDEIVTCYDGNGEPAPLTPAQAELARVYAGRMVQREQVASVIQRQAAVINICADIMERQAGRAVK